MITAKKARKITESYKPQKRKRWKIVQVFIDFIDTFMLNRIEKKIKKAASRGKSIVELRFFGSNDVVETLKSKGFSAQVFYSEQTSCERKKILVGW